jgi:glycosyltransferase A (GT-A) superfamily protein (DUF2064 family)
MMKSAARSKRRLAERIGAERATEAARQLIECARADLAAWRGPVCLAPSTPEEVDALEASSVAAVIVQRGANLGERIGHLNSALLDRGFERQVFIGIDCPAIDSDYLERAAGALVESDVVFGPAVDGGVVLMGVRGRWPPLSALPWSTDALYGALRALCAANGSCSATLETLRDVDTLDDLLALEAELAADVRPTRRALVRWLARQSASGFA